MKIAVIGSRSATKYIDFFKIIPPDTELIISGGATGIDTLAEEYAKAYGIPTVIIKPDYQKYGSNAPLVRDREIVDMADEVYAFWDGVSTGTAYTFKYAQRTGKECRLFVFENKKEP